MRVNLVDIKFSSTCPPIHLYFGVYIYKFEIDIQEAHRHFYSIAKIQQNTNKISPI